MSEGPTCELCRHWDAERLRKMIVGGKPALEALCRVDPARAAPQMTWHWETCPSFAPDMREYPKTTERAA